MYSNKNKKVYIIAEIGVNHNGSYQRAKKLILDAKKCGADAVKFQYFNSKTLLTKNTKLLSYQKKKSKVSTQNDLLKKYELNINQIKKLNSFANKNSLDFLCTFFDIDSLDFVNQLNMKYLKLPSGEIQNIPYLDKIAKFNKPTFISSGLSTPNDVYNTVKYLIKSGLKKNNIIIFHCTSLYPTPDKEVALKNILLIKNKINCEVGFSDHTTDNLASIAAVTLGCKYIERHFTFNKKDIGPDHQSSSNYLEFKYYVQAIRRLELQLNSKRVNLNKKLLVNKKLIEKKIVALTNISKGDIFTENNITTKRSNRGISSIKWNSVINKKSKKDYLVDEPI